MLSFLSRSYFVTRSKPDRSVEHENVDYKLNEGHTLFSTFNFISIHKIFCFLSARVLVLVGLSLSHHQLLPLPFQLVLIAIVN